MNGLVIFAHPNPKSFNAAVKETVEEELGKDGGAVRTHDLYQMNFNPVLRADDFTELFAGRVPRDIRPLQEDITWAELLIVIFPTWWMGPPALLKGYFDRVLTNGFAYRYEEGRMIPMLKGKRALVFQTTGSPGAMLSEAGFPPAMEKVIGMGTLEYCGIEVAAHEFLYAIPQIPQEEREAMLKRVREAVQRVKGALAHA